MVALPFGTARHLALVACLVVPHVARAESAESLRARGEQLARDGRYSEAIDAFKAAEKLEPRARHACLIGLAYLRRELWPQAEIFLAQCEARATAADPVPEWMPAAKQQLAERLASVAVSPVTLEVEPADLDVELAVSSFAPDERFVPRTIHLPPGTHVVLATAAGHRDAQVTVEVTDASPRTVTITLEPVAPAQPAVSRDDATRAPAVPRSRSKVPYAVMGAGAGLAITGAAVHLFLFKPARDDLANAATLPDYEDREAAFDRWRATSIGLYAAGALAIGAGLVLRYTVFDDPSEAPQIAVQPHEGGGLVTVGWTR